MRWGELHGIHVDVGGAIAEADIVVRLAHAHAAGGRTLSARDGRLYYVEPIDVWLRTSGLHRLI